MNQLLIVEDDEDVARALSRTLSRPDSAITIANSMAQASDVLKNGNFDVVVLDLGLPDCSGLDALDRIMEHDPHIRVIVVTGSNDVTLAVKALQRGAIDYLVKPWERAMLLQVVGKVLDAVQLRRDLNAAKGSRFRNNIQVAGSSLPWTRLLDDLRAAAESPRTPVLICGESGTGKDVIATLVHAWSPLSQGAFVTLNAACLPETLLESELFGHEPGAFTGARGIRRGLFELAAGGTLFLDEIGELPLSLQPKLLRVLDGHSFRRLGGEREIKTDVRLVAATNRSLPDMIARGRFREDLYYRLRVLEFHIPPLRERSGDVRDLAIHFLGRSSLALGKPDVTISSEAMDCLVRYHWPGNARELRNTIERAVVLARGEKILPSHLPDFVSHLGPETLVPATESTAPREIPAPTVSPTVMSGDQSLENVVKQHVVAVYHQNAHNLSRTAAVLGITRVALRRKLREIGAYVPPPSIR